MKFSLVFTFTISILVLLSLTLQSSFGFPRIKFPRKIGGSGKPHQHFILMPNRKAAEDAARRQGGGRPPIHHNEQGQRSHFHPSDKNGQIKKDGSHFQYGKKNNG